jgi:hypothetical protein
MSVDQLQSIALICLCIAHLMHVYSHRRPR